MHITPTAYDYEFGYDLIVVGILGPGEGHFGWYANPLLAWSLWRLLKGRPPNPIAAIVGALLAVSALQTFHLRWIDEHGVNGDTHPATGAFIWAIASSVPLIAAIVDIPTWIERFGQMVGRCVQVLWTALKTRTNA